jgi:hypothetical protein
MELCSQFAQTAQCLHELRSREQIHKIETHVTNDNTDLFCGVFRQRTKRIVLYNVKADRPFELVDAAIRQSPHIPCCYPYQHHKYYNNNTKNLKIHNQE